MQILKDEINTKIIEAATDEFLTQGFENASMRKIAHRAKVCASNIYNYYPNKEELFYAVTGPAAQYLRGFLDQIKASGCPSRNADVAGMVSGALMDLFLHHRDPLLILLEKSRGTRFGIFKEEIIRMLAEQFIIKLQHLGKHPSGEIVIHVIARNYMDGFVEILRQSRDVGQTQQAITEFMNYHMFGLEQAFK